MQFGNALDRLIRHFVLVDPAHGLVQLIKVDIVDSFYRIGVRPTDVLKLDVAVPSTKPNQLLCPC
jgi:anion-transporting  ArsA/GET3 family ATPase